MSEHKSPIPSMIYNASVGGHVTNSQQIIDENENKEQSQINAEVKQNLGQGGSVDTRINQAKNDIIGGASSNGNTLKKLEDRVSPLETAVSDGGNIDSRIEEALNVEKTRAEEAEGNLYRKIDTLEDVVGEGDNINSRISNAVAKETIRAQNIESTLQTNIDTEIVRAQTAEEQLRTLYNNLQQSKPIPVNELPDRGEEGKIYRLVGTTNYSDYMWNGTQFIKMATYNNAIDNGPIIESENLVKSGGVFTAIETEKKRAEAAEKILTDEINELVLRIGIYGTFIGTSTHWNSTPYSIELHSDTLYVLKNISNEAFLGYRLFKDGVNIQEKYVTVESGKSISFVPLQDADAIVIYFNQVGSKAEILLFDVSTIVDKLDKSQIIGESGDSEELVPTQKLVSPAVVAVGEIAKVSKPSSGWSNAPIAECHFEEGKRYFIINTGENDFISVRVYDEDKTLKGSFDLNVSAKSSKFVTATATGKYIDTFFKGGGSTIKVYSDESIIAKLQDLYNIKFEKDNVVDNSGNASDKVMTQNATTLLSDSIFSTNNAYLKGIVSILLVTNYTDAEAFRVMNYIHNNSWKLYFVVQKKVGGAWQKYDAIELSATGAEPSGIETITSKYDRFKIVVNWALMTIGSASSMGVEIKNTAIPYTLQDANKDIDSLKYVNEYIREYAIKDSPKHIINVDINGGGDYTSIGAAYNAIKDSAFDNQYEIRVFPGVYNEDNLFPPAYTHTHGLHPNTVIVTSVGLPMSTHPVFDMDKTCKLSNMTIISAYGYCVHQDMGVGGRLCVCENLYCKKVYGATSDNPKGADVRNYMWKSYTNPSVLGMGMGGGSYMLIWKNCTFENGEVASHTNANDDTYPNTTIIYENCKCVNAYIYLMVADGYNTNGKYICDIRGLKMPIGQKALKLTYKEENSPWTILGGDNKNFAVEFDNQDGTTEAWKNVCSNDKSFIQLANGVSASKGQWVDVDGNICNSSTNKSLIFGIALEDMAADSKEALPVWIGNAYKVSLNDGEYGIGADGRLSASANNKVGIVKNRIFYLVK